MPEDHAASSPHNEGVKWVASAKVEKWEDSSAFAAGLPPDEIVEQKGNLLTSAGIVRVLSLIIGGGVQAWDAAHSRLGVGNSAAVEAVGQTDLQAAAGVANRFFKMVNAGYPRLESDDGEGNPTGTPDPNGKHIAWKATYGDTEANFDWFEWGIDQGMADGAVVVPVLLNRKVPDPDLGRKSGGTWALSVAVTLD